MGFSWEVFESSDVFRTLRKLTEQPTEAFTTQDALQHIHHLIVIEVAANRGKPVNGLINGAKPELAGILPDCVADVLVELACRTDPPDQGRLVEFASQLYGQTELDPESGEPLRQDNRKVWSENNSLILSANRTWRDRLGVSDSDWGGVFNIRTCNFSSQLKYSWFPELTGILLIDADDVQLSAEKKGRLVNLVAFTAQLTQAAPPELAYGNNPLHWAHIALWSMRAAFEDGIQLHEIVGTTTLQVACLWFTYAVDAVWACVEKELQGGNDFISGPGSQYKGKDWKGFNKERWDIWVHRLEQARRLCNNSDRETINMIEDALNKAETVKREK